MPKQNVINYTFVAATRTVTFTDFTTIALERIALIFNSTRGQVLFNPAVQGMTGTVATNVLTLTASTAGMADTDKLFIVYVPTSGDPINQQPSPVYIAPPATSGMTQAFYSGATKVKGTRSIKATPGGIVYLYAVSSDSGDTWLQFFNTTSPTLGTTVPVKVIKLPAGAIYENTFLYPLGFTTAISVAATTTELGSTLPTNGVVLEARYL